MGGRFSRQRKAPANAPEAVRLVLTLAEGGAAVRVSILPSPPSPPARRPTPCPSVPEEHQVVRVQLQASVGRGAGGPAGCTPHAAASPCTTCRRLSAARMPAVRSFPYPPSRSRPPSIAAQESFSPNKAVHLVLLTTDKAAQVGQCWQAPARGASHRSRRALAPPRLHPAPPWPAQGSELGHAVGEWMGTPCACAEEVAALAAQQEVRRVRVLPGRGHIGLSACPSEPMERCCSAPNRLPLTPPPASSHPIPWPGRRGRAASLPRRPPGRRSRPLCGGALRRNAACLSSLQPACGRGVLSVVVTCWSRKGVPPTRGYRSRRDRG